MKKMLMTALAVVLFSTNAIALVGTVKTIKQQPGGVVTVGISDSSGATQWKPIVGEIDAKKGMLAILLTAKAMGATVEGIAGDYSGVSGWRAIIIK